MGHTPYVLDGEEIPSVTEVLSVISKPFLYRWYAKNGWAECERIKREAGDIGTRFHDAVEKYLQGESIDLSDRPREQEMFRQFQNWKETNQVEPIELERKVVSRTHRFHGTFDAIIRFGPDGKLQMGDWKTSSSISDDYGCQLAAYAAAYAEETGIEITDGIIVRIDKKADAKKLIEVREFKNLPRYYKAFLDILSVWNFVNRRGQWQKAA